MDIEPGPVEELIINRVKTPIIRKYKDLEKTLESLKKEYETELKKRDYIIEKLQQQLDSCTARIERLEQKTPSTLVRQASSPLSMPLLEFDYSSQFKV